MSADVPGNAWTSSLLNTDYDWQYKTAAQPKANNRQLTWPRGKVLGGSSAINGLYLVRPSKLEYDTWASLMDSQDGGAGSNAWNWDSQFAAMKKSETFTPPTSDVQKTANILYSESNHGSNGPLHASYPGL
jgi:choline dehydrogenase